MARKPVIRSVGSAQDLAEKLGWMGAIERPSMGEGGGAEVPEIGEMVDVSVFALQDMLTIVGAYTGPKDGHWSPAVQEALSRWNHDRFQLVVVQKPNDDETVGFRRQVFNALKAEAESGARAGGARPWYFWPLVITGTVAGIYLLVYMFSKAKGSGSTSEFSVGRRRHKRLEE